MSGKQRDRRREPDPQIADLAKILAESADQIRHVRQAIDEVAEDNMSLHKSVSQFGPAQDALRSLVVQEVGQLRTELSAKLVAQVLKTACRDFAPVLSALERMLAEADFNDAATTRQHVSSLALTLEAVLRRMGIARLPITLGVDLFDSEMHECVHVCTPADSPYPEAPTRTIVRIEESGYLLDGQLTLPAKVWVQRAEAQDAQTDSDRTKEAGW